MASPAKKPKVHSKTKQFFVKQAQISNKKRFQLEVGDKGFLVTYVNKEKDCVREIYKLLNDFNKKTEIVQYPDPMATTKPNDSDDDDITVQLNSAIDKTKQETKEKANHFQALDLGTPGSTFIRSGPEVDHYEIGIRMVNELAETKIKRTRYTNRIVPIEAVCKAKLENICDAAGELFDKHFLKQPSTFAIIFNRKYNCDMNREEIIKQLAELVHLKNIGNKVNLKSPEKTIIVEVLKGMCLMTVVSDYNKLKKFNLHELGKKEEHKNRDDEKTQESPVNAEEPEEKTSSKHIEDVQEPKE